MAHSNSDPINSDEIFGLTQGHLCAYRNTGLKIHCQTSRAFADMQLAARNAGIEIAVASAHRSFDRQLSIWNAKALGKRECLDDNGNGMDLTLLDDLEAIKSIMRYSALPGTSRHHWGTDLDLYDGAAMPEDYRLQLVPSEYAAGGIFSKLNLWLTQNAQDFGFDRPYAEDRGGVAPEPWHLSHQEVAQDYANSFDIVEYAALLESSDIQFKQSLLNNLQYLFERYIQIP